MNKINECQHPPSVSIAIPTYNEAANIERVIRGFLSTTYSNLLEIFVADGGSYDGTQEIVQLLAVQDHRIQLLHNPLKIQTAALNLILNSCSGDIFLRADAHSEYANDYIECCVEALLNSQALNVGGSQRFVAKTPFQAGVAIASRSILGNGGAKYRDPQFDGYADTVYLGCFWKNTLLKVSGYHQDSIVNEDAELNQRLMNISTQALDQSLNSSIQPSQPTSNHAIYVSSKIRVWYYPRSSFKSFVLQYFKYGRGRYITSTRYSKHSHIRGQLPFLVMTVVMLFTLLSLVIPPLRLPMVMILLLGLTLVVLESLRITLKLQPFFHTLIWRGKNQEIPSLVQQFFWTGVVLLFAPIAHFLGYGYQMCRWRILRIKHW